MQARHTVALTGAFLSSISIASAGDWTGASIGGSIGVDGIEQTLTATTLSSGGTPITTEGWIGGDLGASIFAGYDVELADRIVGGLILSYDWSSVETRARGSAGGKSASAKLLGLDGGFSVAGRLGAEIGDNTLFYALGGYDWVGFDDPEVTTSTFSFRHELPDFSGPMAGLGIEHRLSSSISLRAEYRQTWLAQETVYSDAAIGSFEAEPVLHVARIGAAYRFGAPDNTATETSTRGDATQWDGLHFGINSALTAFTRDLSVASSFYGAEGELSGLGGGSVTVGGTAGYDIAIADRWLLGAFGSYDRAAINSSIRVDQDDEWGEVDLLNVGAAWTAGGRISYVLSPAALTYVLAGYSWLTPGAFDIAASNGIRFSTELPDLEGIMIGIGFEQHLTDIVTARAEYRYTDFGAHDFTPIAPVTGASLDAEEHAVHIELAVRPDWP